MEECEKTIKIWKLLVQKIWDDPSLKDQIMADPHKFFKEQGLLIPKSQEIEVHENKAEIMHLVIPKKPNKQLSDAVLSHIVAGIKIPRSE